MSIPPQETDPPSGIIIENVRPIVDCGRHPVKREVGDELEITADIFREGHEKLAAFALVRRGADSEWQRFEMEHLGNDAWSARLPLWENTRYFYTIVAFPDAFTTWREEITKKIGAGLDVSLELIEGKLLVERSAATATNDADRFQTFLREFDAAESDKHRIDILMSPDARRLMASNLPESGGTRLDKEQEVVVDRVAARFAAWYELFPRSAGRTPGKSGTFDDVIAMLPAIQRMGFDVLYFPPIHPIGRVNRKGKNNSVVAAPDDPGVPYAIGNELGGHDAIDPELGTVDDFRRLISAAGEHGLEIALDFAVQAAPDHPWAKEHPEWFHIRPDGSIRYAENPPKRYEDIYPINFNSPDWRSLWLELKRIVLYWVGLGVKTFRVDNPHTKPTAFWEWLIRAVQADHPDVIFLSEAFTRPKVMKGLAKAGFTQSYTYFTWRNFKQEIINYFTELTQSDVKEYMRGNLFTNTPDILPYVLQEGGRPAFKMRLILAATLSSVYGIYSGFELCEATPVPGKEEYLNSEKYEYKVWDWDRPGNIVDYVSLVNSIRRSQPALHEYDNFRFYGADDPNMICYGKLAPDGSGGVLIVVNLDPFEAHETVFHFSPSDFGIAGGTPFQVTELITGQSFVWTSGSQHVFLDPQWEPGLVYALRASPRGRDVDPSG